MKSAILYLVAITGAEMVNSYDSLLGLIFHIFILVALIVHSALVADSPNYKLLLALSLAPLTRILSLSMPLTQFPPIYWYSIIYPVLLVAAWTTMRRGSSTPSERSE